MINKLLGFVTIGQALFDAPALFDRLYRYDWYGGTLRLWIDDMKLPQKTRLLELGCGPGNLSEYMANKGFDTTGADKSERMIKRAEARGSNVGFVIANAYDLPFSDQSFDAVVSASLINVVPEPEKMLAEIHRVLKPEGSASILFPLPEFDQHKVDEISRKRNIGGLSASSLSVWAGVAKKLDVKAASKHLIDVGFEISAITNYLDGAVAAICVRRRKTMP